MKSGLNDMRTTAEIRSLPVMGDFGGVGWEWIGNFIAVGGIWLMIRKVIRWHIPFGVAVGLLIPAGMVGYWYFVLRPAHLATTTIKPCAPVTTGQTEFCISGRM